MRATLPRTSSILCILLAAISGGLCSLAWPPHGWGWLVLWGLAGSLIALKDLGGSRARAIGFLHGLVAFGVGLLRGVGRDTGRPRMGMA